MADKIHVQRIAAKALILNEKNEVLALREAKSYEDGTNIGRYLLPGGRIEIGEPYFDGLKREIREETGLEITIVKPILVSEWFPVIKGVPHQIIGVFFLCKPLTSTITLSSEHDHHVWINPNQLIDYAMLDSDLQAIKTYNEV